MAGQGASSEAVDSGTAPEPADTTAAPADAAAASAGAAAEPDATTGQLIAEGCEGTVDAAAAGGNSDAIRNAFFLHQLAEVYLLLDNISATREKVLPEHIAVAAFGQGADTVDWIQRVGEIHYPPDKNDRPIAQQIAELYRVRDALNLAAAPATSATIAFTLLYAGDQRAAPAAVTPPSGQGFWQMVAEPLRTVFATSFAAQLDPDAAEDEAQQARTDRAWDLFLRNRLSRDKLAGLAFPAFVQPAKALRKFTSWLLVFLIVVMAFTTFLSWSAATGAAMLTRIESLQAEKNQLRKDILEQKAKDIVAAQAAPSPATPPAPSPEMADLLERKAATDTEMKLARDNLGWWLQNGLVQHLVRSLNHGSSAGDSSQTQTQMPRKPAGRVQPEDVNVQWAAVLLTVMANNVLPILYGVLGAGAAVMRNLAAAMRDYLLSPRHIRMALIQLVLGALTGAVIGLFVSHDSAHPGATDGLLQGVFLSTSALCFVAGFGVEGVFQALESLVNRVFNLNGPAARSTA